MKREQIRAPASCKQASCLKPTCLHRKEVRMQMLKEGVCEAGNAAYTRPISSHMRDCQRRIYETSNVVYARQAASNIRNNQPRICEP
ncbi:hypothetical protein EV202_12436 [Bacteroides heparinolyticus]|uniref:Uncharacterized protein n=1 Tax=Prevotella heparinolytica TaxID=28113 RepID=A0A4R2LNM8_9BACE|nr:hypothetical protein EV202_12436 [Bacteroides heparinolyticus]